MAKGKKKPAFTNTVEADPNVGLTDSQVKERVEAGAINKESAKVEKSFLQILASNTFTIFNIVLFSIAAVFLFFIIYLKLTGNGDVADKDFGISKFGFLIPAVLNSGIGSYQEFHSKRVLGKLRLMNQAKATVIRDGERIQIPSEEVVIDDILLLLPGEQCSADVSILEGDLRVDEGILTGESEPIQKGKGDSVLRGSSILVGSAKARVMKVGDDTYAAGLSGKVRELPRHKSELLTSITKIIKLLSFLLMGITVIVVATICIKIHIHNGDPAIFGGDAALSLSSPATWGKITITAGTYAIGLIPEGLVLLTSIALAISIIKLAREKTLVQELYSLENLSRVDTICLDKTGTLTDGSMKVIDTKYFFDQGKVDEYLKDLLGAFEEANPTSQALTDCFGSSKSLQIAKKIPFSSESKSSGIIYSNGEKILLGAPEYFLSEGDGKLEQAKQIQAEGKRVLALLKDGTALALYVIEENIRESARSTLEFFYENGVDVKIISGDSLPTVSKIASNCGVRNAEKGISLEGVPLDKIPELVDEITIFARVSPEQKYAIIEALQAKGRKAAMTGDGVNDILALRKADASITFAKATDAAKSCSDVILLDNDFTHLKEVVGQGRRVVNNIQRSATLFLMKTFTFVGLALLLIPFPKGQMWYSTENIYLMQLAVIGIGGFLLSLESQKEPIRGSFLDNVKKRSILAGCLVLFSALLPICLNQFPLMWGGESVLTMDNAKSMISILTTLAGLVVTLNMCLPFTKYRVFAIAIVVLAILVFAFGLPTSYIGGRVTSFSMFRSPDGNFFHAPVFAEAFQPWNSSVWIALNNQKNCYFIMGFFFIVAFPVYTILYRIFILRPKRIKEK